MRLMRLTALLVFCGLLGTFGYVESQQVEPPTISLSAVLGWDLDWLDTAGAPTTLDGCQVGAFAPEGALGAPVKTIEVPPVRGPNEAALKGLLEGLNGGPYRLSVRVHNAAGFSSWAEPLAAVLVTAPPKPPSGCRLLSR